MMLFYICMFSFGVCTEIIFSFSSQQEARSAQDSKDRKAMVKTKPVVYGDSDGKLLDYGI